MRKALICLLFAVVAVYSATIFGPSTYTRTSGAPDIYDTNFAAYDTTVLCTLVVVNGDADGENRISSASIEFNGVEIIKERDFSERIETITRIIQLESENSLHMRLRSGPGDFLTLSILRACDANVSLALDTIIDGEACFTATAGGWGELTYNWDFDSDPTVGTDGETDTITTENIVCHTYEEADTYWANVRVEDEVGCEAEDDAEVIIELGYHYTFEIDSSYTPWSWTLPDTERHYEAYSISDDGSTVVIQAIRNLRDKYYDFYILSGGALTAVFESVHDVTTNHAGDKLIMAKEPITCCWDSASKVSCYDIHGTRLWGPVLYSEKPVWSPNDDLVGLYSGESFLNSMPAFFLGLMDKSDALDPQFVKTDYGVQIIDSSGFATDSIRHEAWGGPPYMYFGCYRLDLKGYISLIYRYNPAYRGILVFKDMTDDTLKIYKIENDIFQLINEIIPFETLELDNIFSFTCPTMTWASFDHKIYGLWGWSPDSFFSDEVEYITQYVCFDSTGNLLWRQYDTTRAHAHYYSESGEYLIETKVGENGLIVLRQTEDNEILFEVDYPETGELLLADILEHPETGHILVLAVDKSGRGTVFYSDGTPADFDMLGLSQCNNPNFAMDEDGANITFYKVRW